MLDSTLVVWGGEFGRTPLSQGKNGRDHHPYGFSMWMAGGGVKGGQALGATDEFGVQASEMRVDSHDVNATLLRLMGLDHERLTYLLPGPRSAVDGRSRAAGVHEEVGRGLAPACARVVGVRLVF